MSTIHVLTDHCIYIWGKGIIDLWLEVELQHPPSRTTTQQLKADYSLSVFRSSKQLGKTSSFHPIVVTSVTLYNYLFHFMSKLAFPTRLVHRAHVGAWCYHSNQHIDDGN